MKIYGSLFLYSRNFFYRLVGSEQFKKLLIFRFQKFTAAVVVEVLAIAMSIDSDIQYASPSSNRLNFYSLNVRIYNKIILLRNFAVLREVSFNITWYRSTEVGGSSMFFKLAKVLGVEKLEIYMGIGRDTRCEFLLNSIETLIG